MSVSIVLIRETARGERRVAMTPETAKKLAALGATIVLERGAGAAAHFPDDAYAGARIVDDAAEALAAADVLVCVQPPPLERLASLPRGAVVVGLLAPHADPARVPDRHAARAGRRPRRRAGATRAAPAAAAARTPARRPRRALPRRRRRYARRHRRRRGNARRRRRRARARSSRRARRASSRSPASSRRGVRHARSRGSGRC